MKIKSWILSGFGFKKHTARSEKSLDEDRHTVENDSEFATVFAHEIRNPLASLLSSVELLKIRSKRDLENERILESMEDRIRSMGRLLDDMFDISRIARNKVTLKKADIRARDALRRAAESVQSHMSKNRHRFSSNLPDKNVIIYADSLRIEQIVTNLLYNAAKYTPSGGSIDFTTVFERGIESPQIGTLVIRVRDTGVGLTEEEQDRIFEPFMQINPKQSLIGGVGLGLTLAKNLIEMHGGTIDVQSDGLGRGSEFIVRLPARIGTITPIERMAPLPLTTTTIAKPPSAPVSTSTKKSTILVVDDNVDAARGLSKLLQFHGHTVEVAHNGTDALEIVSKTLPDAIVLDIGLPDIDGYEVATRLREANNPTTIIALSGYGQDDHRKRAREAGFDYYLTKPISVEEVLAILRKIKTSPVRDVRTG